jgi:hypothetical protein
VAPDSQKRMLLVTDGRSLRWLSIADYQIYLSDIYRKSMQNAEILRDLRNEDVSRLWREIKRLEKLLEARNKTIRKLRKGISR